jgi:glycosyltransferase involved in cell wall biosynthesis
MSRLRVGVFIESRPSAGGGFQQSLSTVQALSGGLSGHEVVVLTPVRDNIHRLRDLGIAAELYDARLPARFWDSITAYSPRLDLVMGGLRRLGLRRLGRNLDSRLDDLGIDIAFFNEWWPAQRLANHPYIVSVWDLCHRDQPEFPEVSADREFERRDAFMAVVLPKAVAVIADSPVGAERIAHRYHVDPSRIVCVPFLPAIGVRRHAEGQGAVTVEMVRARYKLPEDYVFYPAQFWPHKNHVYVLEALATLDQRHGVRWHAAFSGGDKGNRDHVARTAERLGLADRVHWLGFVDDGEIPALYQGARALVMPACLGPTNLPPLEAALLGCPVIYSDLPEFRQQMGDAALYCDLRDPGSMAEHLHSLCTDAAVIERLRAAGRDLVAGLNTEMYRQRFTAVFDDFADKRRRWA